MMMFNIPIGRQGRGYEHVSSSITYLSRYGLSAEHTMQSASPLGAKE